ncbi:MAG: hypothetical protein II934_02380 [Prevotella sp.]|nr:hypothetical protein [Prevotella sp.]
MAKQPDYIGVSKSDWTRLKRKVGTCKNRTDWWLNIGFTSFGVSASAFLSYLTIPIAPESPSVKPIVFCVGVFTVIIGILCVIAHKREDKLSVSDIEDVKDVINEIDNSLISIEHE